MRNAKPGNHLNHHVQLSEPWFFIRLMVKIIMSRAIKREPNSPICVVGIGIKSWLNCLEKLSFFGCWESLSAASKCRKTHPCDYRISEFSGGACHRTPPRGGVKLSCPPVQNLNEPPASASNFLWQKLINLIYSFIELLPKPVSF